MSASTGKSSASASNGGETTSSTSSDSESKTSIADTSGSSDSGSSEGSSGDAESSTGAPWSLCPMFVDDFDPVADSHWDYMMSQFADTVDGELLLTLSESARDGNVRLLLPPGPTGLLDAQVTVELGQTSEQVGVLQLLRLETPSTDLISYRINGYPSGPRLEVWIAEGNVNPTIVADASFEPSSHRWLRMRASEDRDLLTFETSADGVSFVEFTSLPIPFDLREARVGVAAGNYTPVAEETVSFRQFIFECDL